VNAAGGDNVSRRLLGFQACATTRRVARRWTIAVVKVIVMSIVAHRELSRSAGGRNEEMKMTKIKRAAPNGA
jgi:hypothetical protein